MEKVKSTKERIIYEALRLFSENGYDGVTMREIAAAVGIKGASLYNHFKGKEDIFTAIFNEMKTQSDAAAEMMSIPADDGVAAVSFYHNAGETKLLQMTEMLFDFYTRNEFAVMFRRMLVSEQYKSPVAAEYYKAYYLNAPYEFQKGIFAAMQQCGDFGGFSPELLALHFYSPIFFVISRFDIGFPYDDCLEMMRNHVKGFCKAYANK